jgi:hypothetical protein
MPLLGAFNPRYCSGFLSDRNEKRKDGSVNKNKNWIRIIPLMNVIKAGFAISQLFESCNFKSSMPVILDNIKTPARLASKKLAAAIPRNSNSCLQAGFVLRYVCIAPLLSLY